MLSSLIYPTLIIILLLTFSFGPAFFALINAGIKYGYKTGSLLATGIILSDFLLCVAIILLVHFGATNFITSEKNQRFMGILAGLVLVVFGAFYFKKQTASGDESIELKKPSPSFTLLKGFFLNLFNPTVWLLWLGNVTAVSKTLQYSVYKMIIYFSITLGIVLLIELGKVSAAGKLKRFLTYRLMHTVNIITGSSLIAFGILLIYNHYFEGV